MLGRSASSSEVLRLSPPLQSLLKSKEGNEPQAGGGGRTPGSKWKKEYKPEQMKDCPGTRGGSDVQWVEEVSQRLQELEE